MERTEIEMSRNRSALEWLLIPNLSVRNIITIRRWFTDWILKMSVLLGVNVVSSFYKYNNLFEVLFVFNQTCYFISQVLRIVINNLFLSVIRVKTCYFISRKLKHCRLFHKNKKPLYPTCIYIYINAPNNFRNAFLFWAI